MSRQATRRKDGRERKTMFLVEERASGTVIGDTLILFQEYFGTGRQDEGLDQEWS